MKLKHYIRGTHSILKLRVYSTSTFKQQFCPSACIWKW